jgi:hypothetical protein
MENNFIPLISIEKFAAFLDGNLSANEMQHVSALISTDSKMQGIMELSDFMDDDPHNNYDSSELSDELFFIDFDIPSIGSDSYDLEDETLLNEEGLASLHECKEEDNINFHQSDYYDSLGDKNNINNMNARTLQSGKILYGESGENIIDPIFIRQPDDHSCALRSQQIVLRDFGIDIPFEDLEKLAKEYGVYTDQGTYTYDIGKVLQLAGVDMHQVEGTSLYDLTNELAQGHRVIVSVDASELWYNDSFTGKLKNWFDDTFGNQGGNHALIVAGVEVNPDNPNDVKVVLTDPGAGHLRIEYPLNQFMDAWKDSNCFMAATDNAAPYQYDAETGMEIPSNFAVQQYINEFVASNGYKLSPDMINIPQNYQPAFTGHLNIVGNMDYESFEETYNNILDNQIPSGLSIKEQIEEIAKSHEASDEDVEEQEPPRHEDVDQEAPDEFSSAQENLAKDEDYEKEKDGSLDDEDHDSDDDEDYEEDGE